MYKSIDPKGIDSILESKLTKKWEKDNLLDKVIQKGKEKFVFYEGPPTANGKPGIHHVMSRTIKDTIPRYKSMQGYKVNRKAGWDTHGLPVEIEVQKKLKLDDRKQILKYGIEKFNQKCRESVFSYEKQWSQMTKQMGYEIDLKNPYITLDNKYIESVWWLLNQMFQKNLIYQGHKVVPFCPKCGTPLSSHEVALGYQEVTEPSVYIKLRLKNEQNTYFLAWTTTSWTLPGNVALVVHPDIEYVKVNVGQENYILAKELLKILENDYKIVQEYKGSELEGIAYQPLFDIQKLQNENSHKVYLADFVTTQDGTGIVHTAGMYGEDDYIICKDNDLPLFHTVGEDGKFNDLVLDLKGKFVKEKSTDKAIILHLKQINAFLKSENYKHTYPFCWRCSSPLLYYARKSWYIKTTQYKQKMIDINKTINWFPKFVGEGRFGSWLENNIDWAISRDRFWGTPLNIWVCQDCGHLESVGSISELCQKGKLKSGSSVPASIELHKPYVDDIVFTCPKCQKNMVRVPEVIDCWFDSGAMPFAQHHYPFENSKNFEELFPADFICEGIDQTRGWFYSLLAISTIIMGKAPYKNVLVNDLILDKKGKKMSKSKGNTVQPMDIMDKYGADSLRWYFLYGSPPWLPTKFDEQGVKEISNKFFGTLKNVYSFFVTYANIDNFMVKDQPVGSSEIDRWITSKLNVLIEEVTNSMDKYDLTKSVRAIQYFVIENLSNWFVRRSRKRFWSFELTKDKIDAYATLYATLESVLRLIAPIAPFLVDQMFCNLTGKESIHLAPYPKSDKSLIDLSLEKKMDTIIEVISLGRLARNNVQLKIRQPLEYIKLSKDLLPIVGKMENLIKEEINIKQVLYVENDFTKYSAAPNYKIVGKKIGKNMAELSAYLQNLDTKEMLKSFNNGATFLVNLASGEFTLEKEDVIFTLKDKANDKMESNGTIFVGLGTKITQELKLEGYAREITNKIQFTRKKNKLEVMDRIEIFYNSKEDLSILLKDYIQMIKTDTLSNTIEKKEDTSGMKLWDINGMEIWLAVEKSKQLATKK